MSYLILIKTNPGSAAKFVIGDGIMNFAYGFAAQTLTPLAPGKMYLIQALRICEREWYSQLLYQQ